MKRNTIPTFKAITTLSLLLLLISAISAQNQTASPQPNLPPTVDYLKEAERIQKEIDAKNKWKNANVQQQIDDIQRESQAESERLQELNNQVIQQQDDRLNSISEQQNKSW